MNEKKVEALTKGIYTVYDAKAEFYKVPFCMRNNGEVTRAFAQLANDDKTEVGRNPEDFVLYKIGLFDELSGQIVSIPPESLGKAIDYIRMYLEQPK